MVRSLVRETLEREGYKVLEAASPVQAQRIAESHRGKIQLLITDVVMPRLSGKELAKALVERRPDMKVLYMSGYTDSAIVKVVSYKKKWRSCKNRSRPPRWLLRYATCSKTAGFATLENSA